jgi:hypothetical protein
VRALACTHLRSIACALSRRSAATEIGADAERI